MTKAQRTKSLLVGALTILLIGSTASSTITAQAITKVVPSVVVPKVVPTFSGPVWSPLRTPARVSCVRTNCPGPYHNYWAIDFISSLHEPSGAEPHDPLYAVAAGVFHIGGRDSSCTTTIHGGNWAWIDHGAGRRTRYHHLDAVTATEGQRVTPRTQIGTIGHSGFICNSINYLHMEFRVNNQHVAPPSMFACVGTRRVTLPQSLGYATWDQVPTNKQPKTGLNPNVFTPTSTSDCIPR